MIKKEQLQDNVKFALSDYLKDWTPYLLGILKKSRSSSYMKSSLNSIALQIAILKNIQSIEQTIHKEQTSNPEGIKYYRRLRHIFKDIADGIAWRTLGFNRPLLRILSQNNSSGFLKTDLSKEDEVAMNISMHSNTVLINDITNILRIGDVLVVDQEGFPNIVEVKRSGKKIWTWEDYERILHKGGELSNQGSKIKEAIDAFRTGRLKIGDSEAELGFLNIPIKSYLPIISKMIRKCNSSNNGVYERYIDNILYVRTIKIKKVKLEVSNLPFQLDMNWLYFSSVETLQLHDNETFRNKIPYTCYPIEENYILQIISGEIIIDSFINIETLKGLFIKVGWEIKDRIFSEEDFEKLKKDMYGGRKLFQDEVDSCLFTVWKDGFNLEIKVEMIAQIFMDFLKPEILIQMAEFLYEKTRVKKEEGYFGIAYSNEKNIWV